MKYRKHIKQLFNLKMIVNVCWGIMKWWNGGQWLREGWRNAQEYHKMLNYYEIKSCKGSHI